MRRGELDGHVREQRRDAERDLADDGRGPGDDERSRRERQRRKGPRGRRRGQGADGGGRRVGQGPVVELDRRRVLEEVPPVLHRSPGPRAKRQRVARKAMLFPSLG